MSIILSLLLMLFVALFLARGAKIRELQEQIAWKQRFIHDMNDILSDVVHARIPIDKRDDD